MRKISLIVERKRPLLPSFRTRCKDMKCEFVRYPLCVLRSFIVPSSWKYFFVQEKRKKTWVGFIFSCLSTWRRTNLSEHNPHTYGVLHHAMRAIQNQACKKAQGHFACLATQSHPDEVRLALLLHQETDMATRWASRRWGWIRAFLAHVTLNDGITHHPDRGEIG